MQTITATQRHAVELGLFSDEGLIEGQLYSVAEAQKAIDDRYQPEDKLEILAICPEHCEEPDISCGECLAEEDE